MYKHLQLQEQHERASHRQIGHRAVLWLLVVFVLILASVYAVRFITIARLQRQVAALSVKEEAVLAEQNTLRAELARKNDPQAIEDIAREKLGLMKPGEQLIIFVKGD